MSKRIITEVLNHQLVEYRNDLFITLSFEDLDKLDAKYKEFIDISFWKKKDLRPILALYSGLIKNFACKDTVVETYLNNSYVVGSGDDVTVSTIALEIIRILKIEFRVITVSGGGGAPVKNGGEGGFISYGSGGGTTQVTKEPVKEKKEKVKTIMEKFVEDRLNTNKKRLSDDILESTKERIRIENERNNNLKRMAELEKDLREKVPESLHDDRIREYYKLIGAEHKLPAIELREEPITRRVDEEPKMEDIKTVATPPKNYEGLTPENFIPYKHFVKSVQPIIKYKQFSIIPTVS